MSIIYKKNHLAFLLAIAMFLLVIFGPKFALAQVTLTPNGLDQSPITRGLCNVFEMASGNIGKAIAIFAIVAVGFGFFTGKFSIALVIGITLGIGILFGAPKIIAALTGGSAVDCGNITSGNSAQCPGDISISPSNNIVSSYPFSTVDKSIKIMSGNDELAVISCINYGSAKRVQMSMSINNYAQRTITPAQLLSANVAYGTLSTIALPAVGVATITTADIPANATAVTFTVAGDMICPTVNATLAISTSLCSGGNVTVAAAYGSSDSYMCAPVTQGLGISSITNTNFTHTGTFVSTTSGTLSIKAGFKGDVRKFSLGANRIMRAECKGSKWDITTTAADMSATASNIDSKDLTASNSLTYSAGNNVNITFTP